jgi:hypothetical protein
LFFISIRCPSSWAFTTNSNFLFSSIVKRNLRAIVKKLFSPSGLPRNQIQASSPSPNLGLNRRHQSVSRSQPRIPNHVTKILRSHKKRDPKLFGILTYSTTLSNFFFLIFFFFQVVMVLAFLIFIFIHCEAKFMISFSPG